MGVGAFCSNTVMFFIILTTAITLNRHGITNIETSRQAAEALRPFAGNFATTVFTLGIVGVGFLAIPTLAGSAAYAFAETLGWRQGLNKKLRQARWFYALILVSTGVGVALDFIGINPVKALYWTAVINGLLAPFIMVAILIVAADKKLMQGQPSSRLGWIVVAIATIAMSQPALRCLLYKPNDYSGSGICAPEMWIQVGFSPRKRNFSPSMWAREFWNRSKRPRGFCMP